MTMLAAGVILLIAGAILAVAVPRAREIGALCAVGGIILIVVHYLAV